MEQQVKVDLQGRAYTYSWRGDEPLVVGDQVWLPPNRLHPKPFVGTVIRTNSDYDGPLASVLAKYDPEGLI